MFTITTGLGNDPDQAAEGVFPEGHDTVFMKVVDQWGQCITYMYFVYPVDDYVKDLRSNGT